MGGGDAPIASPTTVVMSASTMDEPVVKVLLPTIGGWVIDTGELGAVSWSPSLLFGDGPEGLAWFTTTAGLCSFVAFDGC